jgi:hypothetical protein
MDVIGHDDEVEQLKLPRGYVSASDADEEFCIALGLQQALPHVRVRRDKECSRRADNPF